MTKSYDTLIIGGGFYGLRIAQFLYDELGQRNILIIEKESSVMSRASYNNQARIHNGYHYPRSVLTALRSRVNLPVFTEEFRPAVVKDFTKYYGVASSLSKVSARQFLRFFERIGAPIEVASEGMTDFNERLIEKVFKVEEFAFNAAKLREMLLDALEERGITIITNEKIERVVNHDDGIRAVSDKEVYIARHVLNTTYSSINGVNKNSGLPIIPFKHELTEMCLVEMPKSLQSKAYTIMCGPFFSIMPFPDKGLHTLSHVRYTPHSEWYDTDETVRDSHEYLRSIKRISHFPQMIADVKRYMPEAKNIKYSGESLWEIKTVLPQSEGDDSRPILFRQDHGGLKNYICIMGGKIDNIYDVFRELTIAYEKNA